VDTTVDETPEVDLDELTALALAADPDAPIPDDAVPFGDAAANGLLPSWYMPGPGGLVRSGRRWRRVVALIAITAFIGIDAAGLCSTYGWISIG
jgi:hypothetical protein